MKTKLFEVSDDIEVGLWTHGVTIKNHASGDLIELTNDQMLIVWKEWFDKGDKKYAKA